MATIWPRVAPTFDQTSICPPPKSQLSSLGTEKRRARDGKEAADDTHWKGYAQSQERELFRRRRHLAKADRAAVKHALQAGTGRQGRKGQRRQGKKKPGRDLHDADPARILYRARRFQTKQRESGWPVLFALIFFPVKQSSGIVQDEERNK